MGCRNITRKLTHALPTYKENVLKAGWLVVVVTVIVVIEDTSYTL